MDNLKRVGRIGGKAILYFEVVTTIALLIGVIVAYLIQPGAGIVTKGINSSAVTSFQKSGGISLLSFFRENSTIQFLILSILLGLFLNRSSYRAIVLEKVQ
ncbi:MAG: hypothetical protein RL512_1014, partial [Bacteroidota bacterium]